MTEQPAAESSSARRRRRRRAASAQGAPAAAPETSPGSEPGHASEQAAPKRSARKGRSHRDTAERSLRDLVGAGKSQVGVSGALRARDVNRPTDDDLADAEQNLVIVRRHWQPPADAPKPSVQR